VLGWLVNTAASALVGLIVGFVIVAVVSRVMRARGGHSDDAHGTAAAH
jgi:predicted DNA repair protein MutK